MNYYYFSVPIPHTADADEYVIFAPDQHQAQIQLTYFATEVVDHTGWSGEDFEKFELSGKPSELENALKLEKAGLGIYLDGAGWKIMSLEEIRSSRYLE